MLFPERTKGVDNEDRLLLSKGNQLLLELSKQCVDDNWDRYVNHAAIQRESKITPLTPKQLIRAVLQGIIGADEHWAYNDSEQRPTDEPTAEVVNNQTLIRTLITSTRTEDTTNVNRLIQLQISGVREIVDGLKGK